MFRKTLAGVTLVVCGFVLLIALDQKNTWQSLYCSTVLPLTKWQPVSVGLFNCTNVVQHIDNLHNKNVLIEKQPDYPGYNTIRPEDESQPAVFRVVVRRDRSGVMLLPRFVGRDCRVQIFQIRDELKRKLFDLRGSSDSWTPVGRRYEVNLGCVENGDTDPVSDVVLEVILTGKWTQLWALDRDVFF